MEKPFDRSPYQDKEQLKALLVDKTPKQVAKEIGVSYKLINIWAVNHGLLTRTPEMNMP